MYKSYSILKSCKCENKPEKLNTNSKRITNFFFYKIQNKKKILSKTLW